MAKMMFCPNCKQNVTIKPQYNLVALIILLLCGIIPGLIYYVLKKDNNVPFAEQRRSSWSLTGETEVMTHDGILLSEV